MQQIRQQITKINDKTKQKGNRQFYQLHYPTKKKSSPIKGSRINHNIKNNNNHNYQGRSQSVTSMTVQQHQNSPLKIQSKNQLKNKQSASVLLNHNNSSLDNKAYFNNWKQQPKYQQKFSLKTVLSAKFQAPINDSQLILAGSLKDNKDLQQWGKRCIPVKLALQKNRQERIKANRILLSQKQSQQIKYQYLKTKRIQAQNQRNQQIRAIYDQFFRKQYQLNYGVNGYQIFQDTILGLTGKLSCRLFTKD